MKKEYLFIFSLVLIFLAQGIDSISGRLAFSVKNPYQFLSSPLTSQYPLTTLGIFCRSIGLFIAIWLLFSLISGLNFQKAIALFIIFVLSNLFSIQQLATGVKVTTVQWTISIAYASSLLLIPLVFYLIKSATTTVARKITPKQVVETDLSDTYTKDESDE